MSENQSFDVTFENNSEREIERYVGIETFTTQGYEGIGGIYKLSHKDFIVREILSNGEILDLHEADDEDYYPLEFFDEKYTHFNLVKVKKDTFTAVRDICQNLSISPHQVYYHGLKDKQAVTIQKMSIPGNYVNALKNLKVKDLYIKQIEPSNDPVKLGGNWGNNFTITLRKIKNRNNLEGHIKIIIDEINKCGFPNYYGLQRYGTFRPNSHIVGKYLIKEDYKKAFEEYVVKTYSTESDEAYAARKVIADEEDYDKAYEMFPRGLDYERRMIDHMRKYPGDYKGSFTELPYDLITLLISSFQSYIFNQLITIRANKGISLFDPVEGDVIAILDEENGNITQTQYIFGGPYDSYLSEAINLRRAEIVFPLIGHHTDLKEFPLAKKLLPEVLEQEDLQVEIFESNGFVKNDFKGATRNIMEKPLGLKLVDIKDDEKFPEYKKVILEFSIHKGSYATMLLREIIK